ncbi:hypothetical protein Tco_1010901 [Tanacetum coccineum]
MPDGYFLSFEKLNVVVTDDERKRLFSSWKLDKRLREKHPVDGGATRLTILFNQTMQILHSKIKKYRELYGMLPDDEPLPNNLGGTYCRNLVEGSTARIFGTDLVVGRIVSALLVVVGQDNLGSASASGLVGNSGNSLGVVSQRVSASVAVVGQDNLGSRSGSGSANGLVGNFGDSLGVVDRKVSAPVVVVGQDNLGSGSASGLVGNSGDSLGVAGGATPRSGSPTGRSGERLVVAGVADPRSVGPVGRSGERLVVADVIAPRSGGGRLR